MAQVWWYTSLTPALGKIQSHHPNSQTDLREFEASLIYMTSSRVPGLHSERPTQKKNQNTKCKVTVINVLAYIIKNCSNNHKK